MSFLSLQMKLVELMVNMNRHQKLLLLLFWLKHLYNYTSHFYYFPRISQQKYLDTLFSIVASFSKALLLPKDPFTIIFCPTFSKISVFRFAISVLQIILSPTPLRWLDYSIFKRKLSKKCLFLANLCILYFSIFSSIHSLFFTIILHLYYNCIKLVYFYL